MSPEVPVRQRRRRALVVWPEMERGLDRLMHFTPFGFRRWPRLWPAEEWLPETDVLERDGKIVVRIDLPGMKAADIEVTVEADLLTVSGKREEEKEVKEEEYYCCERSYGEFTRTVRLPEAVKVDAIEAKYENCVLEVTSP